MGDDVLPYISSGDDLLQIAIYGKGGIGKSTVSANISYQLAATGKHVVQIGCDPKHDSTRLLLDGIPQQTILETIDDPSKRTEDAISKGKEGVVCLEAGGPQPGIGCAGRGILTAFNFIQENDIISDDTDIVLYDVLGDVVCGGFAVPLRQKYSDCIFLVTSGEFMSIFAANNVLAGIRNFDGDNCRVAGIIFNERGDESESFNVENFAESVGIPIIGRIPRSKLFAEAESRGITISELAPGSVETKAFEMIRDHIIGILNGKKTLHPAKPLNDRQIQMIARGEKILNYVSDVSPRKLALDERDALRGCGAAVATGCCWAISDLDIVLHAPTSCSYYFRSGHDRNLVLERRTDEKSDEERISCTDLDERASIFGGGEILRNHLIRRIANGSNNIAVITTCVPGIIGDDVQNICSELSKTYNVTIIPIIVDGILCGAAAQARAIALKSLFSLTLEEIPENNSVNIIGFHDPVDPTIRKCDDIWPILERLGIDVNCKLFYHNSIDEIKHLRLARHNLRYTDSRATRSISDCMNRYLGIDTIGDVLPSGLEDCKNWISMIGTEIGSNWSDTENILADLEKDYSEQSTPLKNKCKGVRALLYVQINSRLNWLFEIAEVMGMEIIGIACPIVNKYAKEVTSDHLNVSASIPIHYNSNFEHLKNMIDKLQPDIVLGNVGMLSDLKTPHYVFEDPSPGIKCAIEYGKRIVRCVRLNNL